MPDLGGALPGAGAPPSLAGVGGDALNEALGKLAETLDGFSQVYPTLGAPAGDGARAEGYRLFLRYLTIGFDRFIECANPAFPAFYQATRDGVRKFAGDSPEQLYDTAVISGEHDYVVSGNMRDVALFEFGLYSGGLLAGGGARRLIGSMTERELQVAPNGDFELHLKRAGTGRNTLTLEPDASSLVVRRYLRNPLVDRPRPLSIRVASARAPLEPLTSGKLAGGIAQAANFALWNVRTWAKWVADARAVGINRLATMPDDGDIYTPKGHRYLSGYWRVPTGKALLISFAPPPGSYWSFVPMNYWMESFEWRFGNPVFASSNTVKSDPGGIVHLALAPVDPGIAGYTWIETMGHDEGPMALRLARFDGAMPTPVCKLADL